MSESIIVEQNITPSVADLLETAKQLQAIEQVHRSDVSAIISSDPKYVKSHFQLIREPDRRGQARYKCLTCSHEFECSGRGRLYQHILGRSWDTVRKNAKSCPSPYEPLRLNLVEFVKNQAMEKESKKRQLETLTTDSLSTLSGDSSETILQPTMESDSHHFSQDEDQTSKEGDDESSPSLPHTKQKRPRIEVKPESFHPSSSSSPSLSPSPRASAPSSSSSSSVTPTAIQEFVSSLLKEDPEDIGDIMMLYHFMKQIKARKQLQEFRKRQSMQLQLQQMQQMMIFQFQQSSQLLQQQQAAAATTTTSKPPNSFLTMNNMSSSSSSLSFQQPPNIVPAVFSSSSDGSNPSSPRRAMNNIGLMSLK
jgi:hypothetical protein